MRRPVSCALVATALTLPLLAFPAAATPHPGSYIVVLRQQPGSRAVTVSDELARQYGGMVTHRFHRALSGYAVTMTADQARRVAADPRVASVELDRIIRVPQPPVSRSRPRQDVSWGLDRIDQRGLPLDGSYTPHGDGKGVTAYVMDSGTQASTKEFGERLKPGYDTTGDGQGTEGCPGDDHGTGVAGVIAGTTYGVAKAVDVVAVRVGGCGSYPSDRTMIAGIDWITTHASRPAVVNLSIGSLGGSNTVETAIKNSIANGITWVIAASNDNTDACKASPGRIAEAITVAASDDTDARWVKQDESEPGEPGSNYGKCVDIFAPGKDIPSLPETEDTISNWTGTSFAAPHVTGAAAMYLSDHQDATPAQVANALIRASTKATVTSLSDSPDRLLYVGAES